MNVLASGAAEPRVLRRPIRVLVVAARFFPDLGGTERHIYEVSRRIARRGDVELTVLATDRSGSLPVREELEGFTVLRCRSYPSHRDYYLAPGLPGMIRNGHYDLVHCQGIHTAVPAQAMMAARRARIPYVVTLHTGGHSSSYRHRLRDTQWRLLGPLLRHAGVVVAVSRFEKQIFQQTCHIDQSRFVVIPNGGDLPVAGAHAAPVPGRIVSSGRLERYKGHHRVIEALPLVQRAVPHATLRILGAGPYEAQLRTRIGVLGLEKSVAIEYIAPDDRPRVAESLAQAAVFTALSEYEAHPVAVMEALTLGIPVVGMNAAGLGDLVEDGLITGIPRNASPATVADALVPALTTGRRDVPARLPSWDAAAADLADIYLDTVAAKLSVRHSRNVATRH